MSGLNKLLSLLGSFLCLSRVAWRMLWEPAVFSLALLVFVDFSLRPV
jgi:hypothetical protein